MSKSRSGMNWLAASTAIVRRIAQTARLMVGVGDYEQYLRHMQSHHPDAAAMTEAAYFRYCQESRYPGKDGSIKRCPC